MMGLGVKCKLDGFVCSFLNYLDQYVSETQK